MKCPNCGENTGTIDSRCMQNYQRRRRQCESCSHRFTTYESNIKPNCNNGTDILKVVYGILALSSLNEKAIIYGTEITEKFSISFCKRIIMEFVGWSERKSAMDEGSSFLKNVLKCKFAGVEDHGESKTARY